MPSHPHNPSIDRPSFPRPKSPLRADDAGCFGGFGGRFVPEILVPNLDELTAAFAEVQDPRSSFWDEYRAELCHFSGRPTPLTALPRLSKALGGAQIVLKREDLNHTGAHKVNNVVGQGLLARRLGKKRLIAETGAGQHGVATATIAARYGFQCSVYMGAEDVERQRPNVFWMEKMGAQVVSVTAGTQTLKDAINEALRDWSAHIDDTHYLLGTACGPHPFPAMVAWFQSVCGLEAQEQCNEGGWQPTRVYACVGGGSNALGIFQGFLDDPGVELIGVEAGGCGLETGEHAARIAGGQGQRGIAQGYETLFLQDQEGQMRDTYSVSAGLDYVGISPILAHLSQQGHVRMASATDEEVLEAVAMLMSHEGIIPALESAHGLARAMADAPSLSPSDTILVNMSGRGDKDIFTMAEALKDSQWGAYLRKRGEALP